jgi:GcrA cell cycle regulator
MTHHNQNNHGWTLDREDLLKKLHGEGLSASQIATRITATGFECTRNAVIGKANRMGLTGDGKPRRTNRSPRKRKDKAGNSLNMVFGGQMRRKSAKLFLEAEPFTPGPELVVPEKERRGIDGLTAEQCRWPIGDPQVADFHFCNGERIPGLPYCECHCRRAYTPPPLRKHSIHEKVPAWDVPRNVNPLEHATINTREKADA